MVTVGGLHFFHHLVVMALLRLLAGYISIGSSRRFLFLCRLLWVLLLVAWRGSIDAGRGNIAINVANLLNS